MSPSEIKTLMVATGGSASERAVALLLACGICSTKDIAESLGLTQRAVQMAKKRNRLREVCFAPEASFAKPASPAKPCSPESEAGFADQPTDTRARAYKESTIVDIYPLSGAGQPTDSRAESKRTGRVIVTADAIYGPTFVLDFAAIDMAAALISFDKTKARQIAEVCARDWVANGTLPQQPMAMVKAAILSQHRGDEVHSVRLARAGTAPPSFQKPKPSAKAEMLGIFRLAEGAGA